MVELNPDCQKLLELIGQGTRLIAMVAPSFPVDFTESQIVYSLKTLGFDKVVDLSLAIATVNKMYESFLEKRSQDMVIAANCPATVNLIKTKYPKLEKYVAKIFPPMVLMGKICKQKYPNYTNVFIGPCFYKKLEAKSYPNDVALALTYKEISEIFKNKSIDYKSHLNDAEYKFEDFHDDFLQIFPASGGVKATIREGLLSREEIIVCDGPKELNELLQDLQNGKISPIVRFLDVLFCKDGCIGGPGIKNQKTLTCYRKRFLDYLKSKGTLPLCSEAGLQNLLETLESKT